MEMDGGDTQSSDTLLQKQKLKEKLKQAEGGKKTGDHLQGRIETGRGRGRGRGTDTEAEKERDETHSDARCRSKQMNRGRNNTVFDNRTNTKNRTVKSDVFVHVAF
ncbi:hypothetical protein WR25_00838 [Diploscapter pachys]|uniref:Uncharacterized protein n=1 Tax=Diploscapter pachys TaxID=2018661 RepID=A0A2A2JV50_9BILA|nr:hypothetical protein WR25_00838 [Diploscapter pachys]